MDRLSPFTLLLRNKVSVLSVFILLIIIPAYHGTQIKDYDLIVGHGNSLTFFRDDLNKSLNISVIERERDVRIVSVVPDEETNRVYFSIVRKNSSSIALYYPEANRTVQIYSSSKGTIGSLTLYQNYLYWCNEPNRTVLKLDVANFNETVSLPLPEIVFTDGNATFQSLTINPADGTIFYTMWGTRNGSKILAFDQRTKTFRTVLDNLYLPRALLIHEQYLYWVDNPPGIYFDIMKMDMNSTIDKKHQLVHRDQNQRPYTLGVKCSNVYWSDIMNKILWEFDTEEKELKLIKYFEDSVPYGLYLNNKNSNTTCKIKVVESTNAQVNKSTITGTLLKKDCLSSDGCLNSKSSSDQIPSKNTANKNANFCNKDEEGYCFNGASCLKLDTEIFCLCQSGFAGPTCAENLEKSRSDLYSSLSSWSSNPPFFYSCIGFTSVIAALLIVILILVLKVKRLDQKPRIRRRVVVSHSRSEADNSSGPSSVCEMIDIENCCNMNVCETPCYERISGAGSSSSKGRSYKPVKEDKKCLLSS